MKKKEYQKPAMRVVKLQQQARLLAGSGEEMFGIGGDGFGYGGGGDGPAR